MTLILHLTLKKKWFDLIASGKKKEEYRDIKPYWQKRLNKDYDIIHFRNGYNKNSPFMIVEYKGKTLKKFEGKDCFAIKLGKVLKIKNSTIKTCPTT
jgi:ASC-1-like (ASCH) protein